MRDGAGVAPDRRPQHEGDAPGTGARVGRGQGDASRQPRDDGPEAPGGGQPRDAALGWADHGEGQGGVVRREGAAVAHAAADQGEDDVLGLVQRREGADPEAGRVVGDEEDRLPARHYRTAGPGAGASAAS